MLLQCLSKLLKQRPVDRVRLRIVFRVPLHAKREALGIGNPDRFNRAVLGNALDDHALARLQDLEGEEIGVHLKAGKQVVKLALEWQDRLAFLVTDEIAIKRLRFLDLVQQEAAEVEAEDAATRFDADFSLMALEFGRFIPRLLKLFGGLADD